MSSIFLFLINGFIGTCIVILMVFAMRFLTRKKSKRIIAVVWLFVIARMICPISLSSSFGIIPGNVFEIASEQFWSDNNNQDVTKNNISSIDITWQDTVEVKEHVVNNTADNIDGIYYNNTLPDIINVLTYIWIFGFCILAMFSCIQLYLLRQKCRMAEAVEGESNIYRWNDDSDACVVGIVKPQIFLPKKVQGREMDMIILHEKTHIRRKDYIVTIVFFIALLVNWFNPLCWIAYNYFRTDIEMACDEETLLGSDISFRQEYARTLLMLGTNRNFWDNSGIIMLFGSGNLKKRILEVGKTKSVLKRQYVGAIALICTTIVLASCSNSGTFDVSLDESGMERLVNIVPDTDYSEVMKERGEENVVNSWMNIIYADEEKVIVAANDGILFVYDYEQNKVVRYISLRAYEINGSLEGEEDVLHMIVDRNGRYIYINEWGIQDKNGTFENVTFGKYRYDINKNSIEEYEFDEKEIAEWKNKEADEAQNVWISGRTMDGIVYGVSIENTDEELWQHNKEQIVIIKEGKAMKYFPFEPGREPESITVKY